MRREIDNLAYSATRRPEAARPTQRYGEQRPGSGGYAQHRAPLSNAEAAWFDAAPPSGRRPVAFDLDERRGWRPPPSHGGAFALVAFFLVGAAAAGTFFFLAPGPKANAHSVAPISTTTVTQADTPAPTEPPLPPSSVPPAPVVSPAAGGAPSPSAPAAETAVPPPPTPAPARPVTKVAPPKAPPRAPVVARPRAADTAPPNLDRAASATGMTPSQEDLFTTPGNNAPARTEEKAPEPPPAEPAPSATPSAPPPAASTPEFELRR